MKKVILTAVALLLVFLMTAPVFAAVPYAPSIEQKPAPVIIPIDDDTIAIIYNGERHIIKRVPRDRLIITALAEAEYAVNDEIKIALNTAEDEIKTAETLLDLCEHLDEIVKEIDPNFAVEDFFVSDLFDVSLVDEYDQALNDDFANNISITFDLGLTDNDEEPVILYRDKEGVWHVIDEEFVTVKPDNTVEVFFLEICPIAVLKNSHGIIIEQPDIESPQTGVKWAPYIIGAVSVLAVACGAFVVLKSKKKA